MTVCGCGAEKVVVFFQRNMAKSSAQRQKEYRERKKANDPNYHQKETKRVLKYYVPRSELGKTKLQEVRRKQRDYERDYRKRVNSTVVQAASPEQTHVVEEGGGPCDSTTSW